MLGGGMPAGRPYLITGGTGSGKTLLCLRFLIEGLRRGEQVLLVAVDEPPYEILENVEPFGWDLSAVQTLDANPGVRGIKRLADVQEIRTMTTPPEPDAPPRRISPSSRSSLNCVSKWRTSRSSGS